jgi:hypothetical protein
MNGKDASQIDYVLESTSMINEYVNFEREALNTSTHDPILVRFSCYLEGKTQNPGIYYTGGTFISISFRKHLN